MERDGGVGANKRRPPTIDVASAAVSLVAYATAAVIAYFSPQHQDFCAVYVAAAGAAALHLTCELSS